MLMGREAKALEISQQALAIYERTLGPHHPLCAYTLCNMADDERALNRYDDARRHIERARAIVAATLGPEHIYAANVEFQLGALAMRQDKVDEAQPHLERALAITEKVRGPEHYMAAVYAETLGELFRRRQQNERAIAMYRRAGEIYEAGANHLRAGRTRITVGEIELETGARAEAVKTLEAALGSEEQYETRVAYLGYARYVLARALWPGDKTRSLALARSAREAWASGDPRELAPALADLDAWVAQHH
jgi:serine/threonine-protein kinase